MPKNIFAGVFIDTTLQNLRQLVSSFPKASGSVTVLSKLRIDTQWQMWRKTLPTITPYYAVKCNPEPFLLQTLMNHGANFDCASLREVYDVDKCTRPYDMQASDILYAHPMKSERDIQTIGTLGIKTTVVDSVEECEKLEMCGWKGSALLRIAVEDKGSKMPFSVKFGAKVSEVKEIASKSRIPITGVSFHVGSGCESPLQYKGAIEFAAGEAFNILRRYKHNPKVVDIGGGFSSDPEVFLKTAKVIQEAIKYIPHFRTLIAEPGRFFAQPSQDLFVKVIAKKPSLNGNGIRYVIDESLYGHFSCIPFDHQTPPFIRIPLNNERRGINYTDAILFGRTCDSLDVIAKGKMQELEVGDWLYFPLMGAYTSATASEFNGFPKPDLLEDTTALLPSVADAWKLSKELSNSQDIKYSNALVPIV
jgi:ornithine decarboxylase